MFSTGATINQKLTHLLRSRVLEFMLQYPLKLFLPSYSKLASNRRIVEPVILTLFLLMCILFCKVLSSMISLRDLMSNFGATNRGKNSVDELFRFIVGIARRTKKG